MLNKSIAYRLKTYITIAVIGVFVVFMIIFHTVFNKKVNESIENMASETSSKVLRNVRRQLVATSEITSNISNQIIFYVQQNRPDLLVNMIMERYPYINAIHINIDTIVPGINYHNYYVYRDSGIVHVQKQNEQILHCLYEEQMIDIVAKTKKSGWTDIFKCPNNNSVVTSYYAPIWEQIGNRKEIVGEVICELSLLEFNGFINGINIGKEGYAFLLSKDGRYLTHPKSEWIYTKSVFSHPKKVHNKKRIDLNLVLENRLSGSIITYPESREFKKHWTYYTKVEETNWILIILMPHKELFRPLYLSILTMLFIAFFGILFISFMINYLADKLVEPLSAATTKLRKFASVTGEEFTTLDEAKLVSESLDYMKTKYQKFKIDQTNEEEKNQRRMQDLVQAAEIQQGLINTAYSDFSKRDVVNLYGLYKPARVVSGDLFDYLFIDDDNLLFTIGDVSGKGVPAALFMTIAQTIIKSNATFKGASTIVRKANNELYTNNQHQFFLTLFLGIMNIRTGALDYCNAAHTPAYILKLNGDIVELSQSHGLPLGLYANKSYSHSKTIIEKGDSIILYTDGVTDLQNENKVQFGQDRFVENLRHLNGLEPKKLVDRIDKSLNLFKGSAKQVDDITFMAIKYRHKKT